MTSDATHKISMIKKVLIVVFVTVGLGTCTHFTFKTRSGTHQTREEAGIGGLPQSATDINHWMKATYPSRVYDFAVDERAFQDWRKRFTYRDLKRQELPFSVLCFDFESDEKFDHEITDGVVYYWLQPHGDQSMTVAYDRKLGRAYFYEATR